MYYIFSVPTLHTYIYMYIDPRLVEQERRHELESPLNVIRPLPTHPFNGPPPPPLGPGAMPPPPMMHGPPHSPLPPLDHLGRCVVGSN